MGGCKNGDFEIRDSRDWKCVGNCGLEIFGPGHNANNFALATIPDRGFGGIDQKLDASCFPAHTMYEINAWIKIADCEGHIVSCDPCDYYLDLNSFCPVIMINDAENDHCKME